MRDRHKSKIKNAFLSDDYLSDSFGFSIPFPIDQNTEVIIDMLMMIHKPPPPHLATFGQYIYHPWESTVIRGRISQGAGIVTVVFDKQEFIPPVRSLLRDERMQKTCIVELDISHEITKMTSLLHGQRYVKALQNDDYKASFIKSISSCFLEKSLVSQWKNTTVIIDSDEFGSFPRIVTDGHINIFERHNNKGEADVGIWFHASKSQLQKILVMASDTDIYMYGMALMEIKRFSNDGDKEVAVELSFGKEFFYVNKAIHLIQNHPLLNISEEIPRFFCVKILAIDIYCLAQIIWVLFMVWLMKDSWKVIRSTNPMCVQQTTINWDGSTCRPNQL